MQSYAGFCIFDLLSWPIQNVYCVMYKKATFLRFPNFWWVRRQVPKNTSGRTSGKFRPIPADGIFVTLSNLSRNTAPFS